jgi:hypothetical protein
MKRTVISVAVKHKLTGRKKKVMSVLSEMMMKIYGTIKCFVTFDENSHKELVL